MSQDQTTQLIGIFKTLIHDHGLPQAVDHISDPEFHALAQAHIDEFHEARDEYESDCTLI